MIEPSTRSFKEIFYFVVLCVSVLLINLFVHVFLQSLDYDTCENKLVVDEERTRGYPYVIQTDVARWFLFFLIGLFTAAIGVFVDVSIAYLADLKYSILKQCILFFIYQGG